MVEVLKTLYDTATNTLEIVNTQWKPDDEMLELKRMELQWKLMILRVDLYSIIELMGGQVNE